MSQAFIIIRWIIFVCGWVGQEQLLLDSDQATGKSFISEPVIPKALYYTDGAWYDGSGKFSSAGKNQRPASTIDQAMRNFTNGCSARPNPEPTAPTAKPAPARSRASRNGNRWASRNASASAG
ncbi:MAG: hypothetical protein WCP12_13940 [bacterium]